MSMRNSLDKWLSVRYGTSELHNSSDVAIISELHDLPEDYQRYVEMYEALVRDYQSRGEPALDLFISNIRGRQDTLTKFLNINSLSIPPDIEHIQRVKNDLRDYIQRSISGTFPAKPITPQVIKTPELGMKPEEKTVLPPGLITRIQEVQAEEEAEARKIKPPKPTLPESPACESIPYQTTTDMVKMAQKSADEGVEYGACITGDLTLDNITKGETSNVTLPRIPGMTGTYHTHGIGEPSIGAGTGDLQDMVSHDDKLMCIGSSGHMGTKIVCYTPNEQVFNDTREQYLKIHDEIAEFNSDVAEEYRLHGRALKGKRLWQMIRYLSSKDYLEIPSVIVTPEVKEQAMTEAVNAEFDADKIESEVQPLMDKMDKDYDAATEAMNNLENVMAFASEADIEVMWHDVEEKTKILDESEQYAVSKERAARNARTLADKLFIRANTMTTDINQTYSKALKYRSQHDDIIRQRNDFVDTLRNNATWLAIDDPRYIPQIHTEKGWIPTPLVVDECKLVWETGIEELPYEL